MRDIFEMAGHTMADIIVSADAVLDRQRQGFKVSPAELYIASLTTWQSRKAAVETLKRLTKLLREPDWETLPWEALRAEQTTYLRSALIRDFSPATARLSISMLKGVLRQAFRMGLMTAEDYQRAILLSSVKGDGPPAGRMLTEGEIHCLATYARGLKPPRGPMVEAVFSAALGGGLRREELALLRAQSLSDDKTHLLVDGKGHRERVQTLPAWAGETIARWLIVRAKLGLKTDRLFVQGAGKSYLTDAPMSVKDVWYLITETGQRAGCAHFTPHDLRRTFASRMLDKSDLARTQKLMGHKNVATTVRYDRRDAAAADKAVGTLEGWGFDAAPTTKADAMKKPLTATVREHVEKKAPPTGPGGQPLPVAQVETLALQVEDATLLSQKVEHPATGQRLVNRRLVRKPDFLRHGAPLDMLWVTGQVRTLAAMGIPAARIASALVKTGVRRGDGSDVGAEDVARWVRLPP